MICSADEAYIPESSFPNITKEILYGIADGRAVFEGKCEDVCTYRLDCIMCPFCYACFCHYGV